MTKKEKITESLDFLDKISEVARCGEKGRWYNIGDFICTKEFAEDFLKGFDSLIKEKIEELGS